MVRKKDRVTVTVTHSDGKKTVSVVNDTTARHHEDQCLSGRGDITAVNVEPTK